MQRLFLPVGQGAFYCEKFSDEDSHGKVNVVYDCGSISGLSVLKSMIEWAFEEGEAIDGVFISHLHEDHVNGLPILMRRCRVKRVYLPMIHDSDLALMLLGYIVGRHPKPLPYENLKDEYRITERFVEDILANPTEAFQSYNVEVEVVPISQGEVEQSRIARNISAAIFEDRSREDDARQWIYEPFNIAHGIEAENVRRKFIEQFAMEATAQNVAKIIEDISKLRDASKKKEFSRIRDLYKGIKGGFNAGSMTLYSGGADSAMRQYPDVDKSALERFDCKIPEATASGCLYTGDFIASENRPYWTELRKAFNKYWSNVGCVQIPHHGSFGNFNDEILNMAAYNVISVGFGNMYHHPSNAVLSKYQTRRTFPFVVTQNPSSMFSTTIV